MDSSSLTAKDERYYNFDKARIAAVIPKGPHRILDVGCAAGGLGRKLREQHKVAELVGIEIFTNAADRAAQCYDRVYREDVETMKLPVGEYFDYVVCGDILEHLRDPWTTLGELHRVLKPEGVLIASIPNVRYWRVLRDLILLGQWKYVEAGILDDTHLRFFTRLSFLETLGRADFEAVSTEFWVGGWKQGLANRMTFRLFEEFLGSQMMIKAVKAGGGRKSQ
jgi:O-antigen biosynthesis protein